MRALRKIRNCLTNYKFILQEGWCDLNLIEDFIFKARKQNFMVSGRDIVHTNPNAVLEEAIGTFIHTLAQQEIKRK